MDIVSVVIPVYNMSNSIESCVTSILAQDYTELDIILVDDGSKDDSYDRCKNLERKDRRIRAFHTANQGSGPARNYGISKANGRYIYFPDADDYLEPYAISTMVDGIKTDNCDLLVFGFKNVNQNGKTVLNHQYDERIENGDTIRNDYSEYYTMYSPHGIQGAPWNKLFDLNLINQYHIEFPSLRRHQDEGFIARYMTVAKKVHFIKDVLYTYYINDQQKEWQKYPINYIDSVMGLFDERKKNILVWNPNDKKTHTLVYREYVRGVIRAIELSFAPKMNLNRRNRKKWIKDVVHNAGIKSLPIEDMGTSYQNLLLNLMKYNHISLIYLIIQYKTLRKEILGK